MKEWSLNFSEHIDVCTKQYIPTTCELKMPNTRMRRHDTYGFLFMMLMHSADIDESGTSLDPRAFHFGRYNNASLHEACRYSSFRFIHLSTVTRPHSWEWLIIYTRRRWPFQTRIIKFSPADETLGSHFVSMSEIYIYFMKISSTHFSTRTIFDW